MSVTERRETRLPEVWVGATPPGRLAVSVVSRSLAANLRDWTSFAAVAVVALAADQILKALLPASIALGQETLVAGPFSLTHVRNSGIAFGLFPNWTPAIAVLTGIVVAALLVHFTRSGASNPLLPVALGLLAGGSLSNLADRIRLGYVTDYLHFEYWPSFNLADTFIVAGVGCLLVAYTGVPSLHAR